LPAVAFYKPVGHLTVVLLDHRVGNRTYGRAFLDALPRAAVHLGTAGEMAPAIAEWIRLPRPAGV